MAPLASVSVASIAVGFISFSFTLAIWLHAFWDGNYLLFPLKPSFSKKDNNGGFSLQHSALSEMRTLKSKMRFPSSANPSTKSANT
jgi:hypothetical protein